MSSLRFIANSSGPLLQIALLLMLGKNHWGNSLLVSIICSGCVLWPGVIAGTLALKDLPPFEKASQGNRQGGACSIFREEDLDRRVCGVKISMLAAFLLELVSFITCIGAGMTIKFFPLFFRFDYHFTPLKVCTLSFVTPLCTSAMVQVCRRVSKRLGRLRAVMTFHFLGTACLWVLCYCKSIYFVIPVYLMRGSFMNARGPIVRSMIMDLVPNEMRGRWNSIQSLNIFTWSGSAALGGYLADISGDYRFTFVVTASIYSFAFSVSLLLLLVYPEEQVQARQEGTPMELAASPTAALPHSASEVAIQDSAGLGENGKPTATQSKRNVGETDLQPLPGGRRSSA
eukprot:TRINITY_DN109300_c0_g1_i1.p1 TRINITY_DN109300_c0_g1~~TRINITY_DN109300_c0_g1_i1.p1  ORF type:complete len:377 (-),score=44.81 TRINITY_DN109300_c0_g1_i1:102-1130(-)